MSYLSGVTSRRGNVLLVALALVSVASAAGAQDFTVDPIDEKARALGVRSNQWVGDPSAYAASQANFNDYFQKYFFPAMTRSSSSDLTDLGKLRVDLFKKYLWGTTNEELRRNLTAMAYDWSLRVAANLQQMRPKAVAANPPYHPAVRYNAVLVLGMLDEQYAIDGGGNARPSRPLPAANTALTKIVERATTSSQFPPPVILGALIGLERHARYRDALPAGAADKMTAALLTVVNQDKPIQELDPETYSWLRFRAGSALARLGSLGPKNSVHDGLAKMIADSKSIDDRCAAAALLGKLKYEGAKLDGTQGTAALFKLAHDVGVEEAKRAEDYEKMRAGGGSGFGSMRSERMMMSNQDSEYDPYPRRQVLARLVQLRAGLRAVRPAVPEESQTKIDAVLAAIKPAIDAASDMGNIVSLRVAALVRDMAFAINEATGVDDAPVEEDGFSAEAPAADPAGAPAPAATAPAGSEPAAPAPGTATPPATGAAPADASATQ